MNRFKLHQSSSETIRGDKTKQAMHYQICGDSSSGGYFIVTNQNSQTLKVVLEKVLRAFLQIYLHY